MSMIETLSDVKNSFLSRREITCNFAGLGGKLKKLDAIDMITKEFKLDGKVVVPIKMSNHTGRPVITGTFYVYDEENLAKKQINPVIFKRLEKAKKKSEEPAEEKPAEAAEASEEKPAEEKPAEEKEAKEEKPKEEKPAEEKEVKAEEKAEEKKE